MHEVWRRHFLQFLNAKQTDWIYSRVLMGYAFGEGWARYTEEMMVEAGPGSLNYNMGKLIIKQHREDGTRERRGCSAWKEFHDIFLGFGDRPIPLARK